MVSLTFLGLWCLADKFGVMEDRPLRIKAELFPYRNDVEIEKYLSELSRLGFIIRYENSGNRYLTVKNFRRHQSPHHTEKARGFPFYTDPKSLILADNGYVTVKQPCRDGESQVPERSDSLIPDTGLIDSLIPEQDVKQPVLSRGGDEWFAIFWKQYPKKTGKQDAARAWKKINAKPELFDTIMAALAVQSKTQAWTKSNGEFVPNPATWLNGKRWEDEVKPSAQSRHGGFDGRDYNDSLIVLEDGTRGF
jgi:hypothetical protein